MPYSIRPRESDTRCPDGFACYGWRRVCAGGYVRWYGHRYYSDDLKQYVGLFVWVEISDWLAIELDIFSSQGDREALARGAMESDIDYLVRKGLACKVSEVSP